ncbi:MAG: MlaE family lipid ABC transporter permease subunit [Thermodesulfobacteriota bacterium]
MTDEVQATPPSTGMASVALHRQAGGVSTLELAGPLDRTTAAALVREVGQLLAEHRPATLLVDMARITALDDFGVLVLLEAQAIMAERRRPFALVGLKPEHQELLGLVRFEELTGIRPASRAAGVQPLTLLGEVTIRQAEAIREAITFVGSLILAMAGLLRRPRGLRLDEVWGVMERTGVQALPIVGLISFLLGLIMAFMSAVQLQQFGANVYVASLVSLAMTRELGPIMTAILVAGRSGSAYAAEIATMKISEEVDALVTMGLDPVLFLAVPRLLATVAVVPFLTLFSDVVAIAGGLVVGIFGLDLTVSAYLAQTAKTLTVFDVFWGAGKSMIFAVMIAGIGCLRGFQARGGPAAVGQATTSSVVTGIFLIIVWDSLFAVILRYWRA